MEVGSRWSIRSITRTLFPVLLLLTVLELVGGLTLGFFESSLLTYPSLLVLVPVTIGTAGNLGSVLSARLSTAFHLGVLSFTPNDEVFLGNALSTLLLALTVFPLIGAGAWGLTWVTGQVELSLLVIVRVAFLSGVVLALLAVIVTVIVSYAAYRFEMDPDNIVLPVVTNVCDVLGVVILFVVARSHGL